MKAKYMKTEYKGIYIRGDNGKVQVDTTYKRKRLTMQFADGEKKTIKIAYKWLLEQKRLIDSGEYLKKHKTLREVYNFMDNQRKGDGVKKEQTSINTESLFENHIATFFNNENKYIDEYTADDIRDFQEYIRNKKLANGKRLAKSTQGNVIGLLKQIFKTATKQGWLLQNKDVSVVIDKPKKETNSIKVFTPEQVKLLYTEGEKRFERNPNYLGILKLGCYGGLRIGEMRGLRWVDVDFDNHEFHVGGQFHCALNRYTDTKTEDSERTLGMLPTFESVLKRMYDRASVQAGFKRDDYVLTSWHDRYTGKPLCFNGFYEMLGRITVACGLPEERRIHVLRKTCGTNMFRKGYDLKDVSGWLGHSDPKTTWKHYTDKDSVRESTYNKMLQDYEAKKGA